MRPTLILLVALLLALPTASSAQSPPVPPPPAAVRLYLAADGAHLAWTQQSDAPTTTLIVGVTRYPVARAAAHDVRLVAYAPGDQVTIEERWPADARWDARIEVYSLDLRVLFLPALD